MKYVKHVAEHKTYYSAFFNYWLLEKLQDLDLLLIKVHFRPNLMQPKEDSKGSRLDNGL